MLSMFTNYKDFVEVSYGGRVKMIASSKQQAASSKQQAASSKQQAAGSKQ